MVTANHIIELQNITKRFGDSVVAVNDVSLQIDRGEFLTLLGPSGCGKTTTLRMIAGLETVTSGRILLNDQDVTYTPPYARDTNMMFQDYALFPHMTIEDNIAFGLKMRRVGRDERRKKAQEMLEFVQLPHLAKRKPNQLSGGQRQRIAMARSLILQPAVLLLDEPLGALDAELRRQMQVELKRIQRQIGVTFIYVTHDQEEALTMSDRIVVMQDGAVEQIGPPREIYEQPRTTFVARFIGQCNFREGPVVERNDVSIVIDDPVFGRIRAKADKALKNNSQNQTITVAVRPEKIKLGVEAEQCLNQGHGTLKDKAYKGSLVQYIIEVGSNDEIIIEVHNGLDFPAGSQVQLGWNIEDAIALSEKKAQSG
jgi:spermidine/putrescine ABC transporter ATP-binding subunit